MGWRAAHGLFINGLRPDIPTGKLKDIIYNLLVDLNIPLKRSHIKIIPQNYKKIAFVDLVSQENTAEALKYLSSEESRDRLNFNFDFIANDHEFCIKRIKENTDADPEKEVGWKKSNISNNGLKTEANGSSIQSLPSKSNSGTGAANGLSTRTSSSDTASASSRTDHGISAQDSSSASTVPVTPASDASTSAQNMVATPRLISLEKGISVQSLAGRPSNRDVMFVRGKALDAATSVSGLGPVYQGKFYHYNEKLGSETRNVEFKEGKGNYKTKTLSEHVGTYVCGFANTLEGGTLYMGVTDKGLAQGVICSHTEEDQIRLRIDEAIKNIEPSVLPNMYSVAFTPVLGHGTFSENLKVIEVCVHPLQSHEELYEFHGKVYVRRDGSVQNFKPKDIKEWAKKKAARDQAHNHSMKQQLDEVTNQLQQIQTHIQNNPAKKSKVCLIL